MRTILAVGLDEGLLHSRAALLRKCGGQGGVVAAETREAIEILKRQRFDLVVLCHTLNIDELIRIAILAHNLGTDVKVLQIVRSSKTESDYESVSADDMVLSDPKTFMEKVEKMLSVSAPTSRIH